MATENVWRSMVDSAKAQLADGPQDLESLASRALELLAGGPDGHARLVVNEALRELRSQSRATA